MKAKTYLSKIEIYEEIIKNKRLEIEKLEQLAYGIGSSGGGERVQSSSNPHKGENVMCRMIDMKGELEDMINVYSMARQSIIATIETLSNKDEYALIYRCYVDFKELREIARENGKSYSWAKKVHRSGLEKIQMILDEEGV